MILHLDKGFKPNTELKEIAFESFTFAGGEPHIKITSKLQAIHEVTITHRVRSFNDMGLLLVATNALRNLGVETIHLMIPYFPGARQDRFMVEGEAMTVKVYASIINQQNYKTVSILDPHSDVTPALVNNCKVIENYDFIEKVTDQLPEDLLLISPDGGALKKIYKLAAHLQKYDVVECSKSRDVKTGQLSGFKVYADDLEGKDCLIVDDICDGGGTFLGLAKEMRAKNAGKIYLAVSHGIFSKGVEGLTEVFEKVFTTNSFQSINTTEKIIQLNL